MNAVLFGLVLGWLVLVGLWFRRSKPVLPAGLLVIGACALGAVAVGAVEPVRLGLVRPRSWPFTVGLAAVWTVGMLAYSPLADVLARRRFPGRPDLSAFDQVRQSRGRLIVGIAVAWVLGGFLEELVFRGIVLRSVDTWLGDAVPHPVRQRDVPLRPVVRGADPGRPGPEQPGPKQRTDLRPLSKPRAKPLMFTRPAQSGLRRAAARNRLGLSGPAAPRRAAARERNR